MLELQRFVVKTDRFVELPTQVVDETQREEGLRVAGIQADTLLEVANGTLVLLGLPAGVGQVGEDGLHHPVGSIRMT